MKTEYSANSLAQLNVSKKMQIVVSSKFLKFLKPRSPFITKHIEIRSVRRKSTDEVRGILKLFYDGLAGTISKDYFYDFKCPLMVNHFE